MSKTKNSIKPRRSGGSKTTKKVMKKRFVKAKEAAQKRAAGGKPYTERADKGADASVAIERMPEPHRSVARAADKLIRKLVPGTTGTVKWGNAVYAAGGKSFCCLYETRASVNLGLPGAGMKDPAGLLEGTGKVMRHVKLHSADVLKRPEVEGFIRAAVKIGLPRM